MNTKARFVLTFALALLAGLALVAVTWAAPGNAPLAQGGAPEVVSYQGKVRVGGTPYTGNGYFKFAVVNAAGGATYWSNDGSSTGGGEPTAAVQLAVSEGLFSVLLGDTTLGGMTQALTTDVFSQPDRYLRVWFSASGGGPFDQLTPDTRIAAVPYALQAQEAADAGTVDGYEGAALEESSEIDADVAAHTAIADAHHARYTDGEAWAAVLANDGPGSGLDADTVDGLHASELETHYQNVVVVAKSGGDYTSVQAAIDSITGAAADNPYLVWVAPGVYSETVTMSPYVHLQGAGQEATIITSAASSGSWPPTQATLVLTRDASLRDLTVVNSGAGDHNAALLATAGMSGTLAADVTARAQGGGVNNYAIVLTGSTANVTLQGCTAMAEDGTSANYGLFNYGAEVTLRGGFYTGRGGADARGISNYYWTSTLEAENVTALGEDGTSGNYGLCNEGNAAATLRGGSFTGRGGNEITAGIYNNHNVTSLEAERVSALGEDSSGGNYGLRNEGGAEATLRGGTFTGRGGYARGIYNKNSGTTLEAESVTALAENGFENYGLYNLEGAEATLRGGSFTGHGGQYTCGFYNNGSDTTLEVENVTALGENGVLYNWGLYNKDGAAATLHGGSFTGRGGNNITAGIYNGGATPTLDAIGVSTRGENNNDANYGLYSEGHDGLAIVVQSVLAGETKSVYRYWDGFPPPSVVAVRNSRLVGGAPDGVTCTAVSRGATFNATGCP
jgi:hypothetical protein